MYSPFSSVFGTVSLYSAAGNPPVPGSLPSSAAPISRETPKATPPATTSAPTTTPTIRPVRVRRGGGNPGPPGTVPQGWGAGPCGYP